MKRPDTVGKCLALGFYLVVMIGAVSVGILYLLQLVLMFYGASLQDIAVWGFQAFRKTIAVGDLGATAIVAVLVVIALVWRWLKAVGNR
ncbi:MAG: hypothetical protein B7W99_00885 [Rhodospirillales bacterium 20-58-10]|nr:MAG: hypothetical protein B7W99_00885 [Rhodospirillales bacterium 20-58-10]